MGSMSRWLVAGALLGCWGCAFSLDGPSPNRPRNRVPVCDTSKGLVALDGVMAAALGVLTLSVATEEPAAALIPLGLAALYVGGAVSGSRTVDKCREAIAGYEGSYQEERYGDQDDDEPPRRSKTARAGRPNDPYSEQPSYPRPQQFPPPNTSAERPTYPPTQQQRPQQPPAYPPPQPPAQQPPAQQPVEQPPVQQPQQPPVQQQPPQQSPAKRPPAPTESDGDWSDFWREVP